MTPPSANGGQAVAIGVMVLLLASALAIGGLGHSGGRAAATDGATGWLGDVESGADGPTGDAPEPSPEQG